MGVSILVLFPYLLASTYVRTHFMVVTPQEMQNGMVHAQKATTLTSLLHAFPPGLEIWLLVLAVVYFFLVVPLLFGMIVHLTAERVTKNHDVTLAEAGDASFHRLLPNMWTLFLASMLFVVAAAVYTFVLSLLASLIALLPAHLPGFFPVLAGPVFFFAFVGLVLNLAFFPGFDWGENFPLLPAVRRSFRLPRNHPFRFILRQGHLPLSGNNRQP